MALYNPDSFSRHLQAPRTRFQTPRAPRPPRPQSYGSTAGQTSPPAGGLPVDPIYDQTIGGLGKSRDDTIAGLLTARTQGLAGYGYTASYDPTGQNVTGLQFDPSNPYSQAALLQTRYQQSQRGNTNSYAARGQLYAGSLQNAQDTATTGYQQGQDSLQKAVLAFLSRNQGQINQAGDQYDLAAGQAYGDRVGRAPQNPATTYSPVTGDGSPQIYGRKQLSKFRGGTGAWGTTGKYFRR